MSMLTRRAIEIKETIQAAGWKLFIKNLSAETFLLWHCPSGYVYSFRVDEDNIVADIMRKNREFDVDNEIIQKLRSTTFRMRVSVRSMLEDMESVEEGLKKLSLAIFPFSSDMDRRIERIRKAVQSCGWELNKYGDVYRFEAQSPYGVSVCLETNADNIASDAIQKAESFNVDDFVMQNLPYRGSKIYPSSIKGLVCEGEVIAQKYKELAKAVTKAVREEDDEKRKEQSC